MLFADDNRTVKNVVSILNKDISIVQIAGYPILIMEADNCQRVIKRNVSEWKQLMDFAYFLNGCV